MQMNALTEHPRGVTPYNALAIQGGSAQKGYFFRCQVYKWVVISQVEVHERERKSVSKS